MAIPPHDVLSESWVRAAFLSEHQFKPTFFTGVFRKQLPTEASIRADVAKLRSVSAAGAAFIVDRRMAIASVGPWRDTFVLPRKGGGYPAIITRARQEGVTYSLQLRAAQ